MVPVREKPEQVSEEPTPLEHALSLCSHRLLKMSLGRPESGLPSPLHVGEIMRIEALLRAGEDVHIRGDGLYEDLPQSA